MPAEAERRGRDMRSAIVILILCILVLLAFWSVWYPSLTGEDEDISDMPLDASWLLAPAGRAEDAAWDLSRFRCG
jgi:hypothetical protein